MNEFAANASDPSTSRKSPRRTDYDPITLERGVIFCCWPSEYVALSELDSNRGVTETLFDRALHPLAATAVLELVVQIPDAGGSVLAQIGTADEHEREQLAAVAPSASLDALGLSEIP